LVFAFGGYEVIGIPAGEAADPRRHMPFAFVTTIVAATAIMTLTQIVAMGTLPNLATSTTPIADASLLFMGGPGALLVSAGAVISMIGGNIMGNLLAGSRILFALADNGSLPRFFGAIHPRYGTPSNAIIFSDRGIGSCTVGIVHRARRCERNRPARDVHKRQRGDYPTASPILPGRSSARNFRHSIGRARTTTRNNRVVADARRSHPPTVAWRYGRALGGCGTVYCE
jgi:hypothetical protein